MHKKNYLILPLLFISASLSAQTNATSLVSPDGRLTIHFQTVTTNLDAAPSGQLVYDVSFQGKAMLSPSALSLTLEGQPPLGANVRIVKITPWEFDDSYTLVSGKSNPVRDQYHALKIELEEPAAPNRKMTVEARAYDDAIAFRYVVPEQPALKEFRLAKETTEFRVTKDATSYALQLPNFKTSYESEFIKRPVSSLAYQGHVYAGLPLLMQFPGIGWMAITEADVRDYSSMYLQNPAGGWPQNWLESRLATRIDDTNICVAGTLPHHSAWRILLIGNEPVKFIESTVITSLSPPQAIPDTTWIHAGKSSWDWWGGSIGADGVSAFNDATMRHYVDFSGKNGFEYMLVDAGWSSRTNMMITNGTVDIPALVRYAAPKNVKIWVWAHWEAVNGREEDAFSMLEKWGVVGIKIDFMSRDDQQMLDFYYRVAETAAKHHVMVDFHGATKPTGIDRTWPNVLGYEAVMGLEWNKASARDNPDHRLMLPFTRMLAGPIDYTPGAFNNVTREEFHPAKIKPMVLGTRAQQLAIYVVYLAPFQMVSDYPQAYDGQPEFQFIKDVPANWDETRGLNGVPGEYITVARRHGDQWFLGSMSNWDPRELKVPLTFLGAGKYTAEIYADAPDAAEHPKHVTIQKKTVTNKTQLKIQLASGGGCAVRFVPKP